MNAPIDRLHAECLAAQAQVRSEFEKLQAAASSWSMAECPRRPAPARPLPVWRDNDAAIPLTQERRIDPSDAIYGDDPLLMRSRRWMR